MTEDAFILFIMNQIAGNGHNHIEDLELLNREQLAHYQTNKKAINRIKYHLRKKNRVTDEDLSEALRNITE